MNGDGRGHTPISLCAERGTLGFTSDASVRALVRHAPALDEERQRRSRLLLLDEGRSPQAHCSARRSLLGWTNSGSAAMSPTTRSRAAAARQRQQSIKRRPGCRFRASDRWASVPLGSFGITGSRARRGARGGGCRGWRALARVRSARRDPSSGRRRSPGRPLRGTGRRVLATVVDQSATRIPARARARPRVGNRRLRRVRSDGWRARWGRTARRSRRRAGGSGRRRLVVARLDAPGGTRARHRAASAPADRSPSGARADSGSGAARGPR